MAKARYIGFTLEPELDHEVDLLRGSIQDGTVRKPLDLHVTVITPPMMDGLDDDIGDSIKSIVGEFAPFEVVITGPHSYADRTLYLGISSQELINFQARLMRELGIDQFMVQPIGKAVYTPHVTLIQSAGPMKLTKETIETISSYTYPKRTTLRDLHLFENVAPRTYKKVNSFEII